MTGLLKPKGWRQGLEPINAQVAQELYDEARTKAKERYLENLIDDIFLTKNHKEKRAQEKEKEFNEQLQRSKFIYDQPVIIANEWDKVRKALHQKRIEGGILPKRQVQTHTAGHAMQRVQEAQLPSPPHAYLPNSPLSAGSQLNRIEQAVNSMSYFSKYSFHADIVRILAVPVPWYSPISPGILDPRLVPQSMDAMWSIYHSNRDVPEKIRRDYDKMIQDNENFKTLWCQKHEVGIPVDQVVHHVYPPSAPNARGNFGR